MVLVVCLRASDGTPGVTNHPELGDMPTGAVMPLSWCAVYDFHALDGKTGAQSETSLSVAAERDRANPCCYMLAHLASWAREFPHLVWTVGKLAVRSVPHE